MKVKIGPVEYSVEPNDERLLPDKWRSGEINYLSQKIIVSDSIAGPDVKAQTIMHECIHGVLHSIGENEKNDDEGFVERLSSSVLAMLKESPELTTMIVKLRNKKK